MKRGVTISQAEAEQLQCGTDCKRSFGRFWSRGLSMIWHNWHAAWQELPDRQINHPTVTDTVLTVTSWWLKLDFYRATLPCRILWQQARAFEASEVRLLDELVLFTHRTVDLQPQTCRRRAGRRPVHNAATAQQFWLSSCTANMAEYLSFGRVQPKHWSKPKSGCSDIQVVVPFPLQTP